MKPFLSLAMLLLLFQVALFGQAGQSRAKRTVPKEVPDVRYEKVILQRSGMEYVQALDSATKKIVWKEKIYDVTYIPYLEKDVQDVFIDSMYLLNKKLMIRNESREWFSLDLQTHKTKRL